MGRICRTCLPLCLVTKRTETQNNVRCQHNKLSQFQTIQRKSIIVSPKYWAAHTPPLTPAGILSGFCPLPLLTIVVPLSEFDILLDKTNIRHANDTSAINKENRKAKDQIGSVISKVCVLDGSSQYGFSTSNFSYSVMSCLLSLLTDKGGCSASFSDSKDNVGVRFANYESIRLLQVMTLSPYSIHRHTHT